MNANAKEVFRVNLLGVIQWFYANHWHDVVGMNMPHIKTCEFDEKERRKVDRDVPVPPNCYETLRIMMIRNNARVVIPQN